MPCLCSDDASSRFISATFGECIGTPAGYVTFAFGWISIAFWAVSIFFQIRLNFCTKKAEALSAWFILQWLTGDICNTASTILLKLLFTQQFLAAFYVFTDLILIAQMAYYAKKKSMAPISHRMRSTELIVYVASISIIVAVLTAYGIPESKLLRFAPQLFQQCDEGAVISKAAGIAGTILSYLTIPFYGLGRPFQIWKNYKRKSVEGLSLGLFLCTLGGNITQCISIVAGIIGKIKSGADQAPFIVSCLWPATCDAIILGQFYFYNHRGRVPEK